MRDILLIVVLPTLIQAMADPDTQWTYTNQKQPANNVILERVEFENFNKSLIKLHVFIVRPITWNVFKINVSVTLTDPVNELWAHGILFRKYNTYKKFLIDITFDVCGFFNGTASNPVAQYIMENYLRLKENFKMNFNLQCPFSGAISVISDHFNSSELVIPLLSAGRYRWDVYGLAPPLKKGLNSQKYFVVRFFFEISDLRVWF